MNARKKHSTEANDSQTRREGKNDAPHHGRENLQALLKEISTINKRIAKIKISDLKLGAVGKGWGAALLELARLTKQKTKILLEIEQSVTQR